MRVFVVSIGRADRGAVIAWCKDAAGAGAETYSPSPRLRKCHIALAFSEL